MVQKAVEQKAMRPATARILAAVFLLVGLLLGTFAAPHYIEKVTGFGLGVLRLPYRLGLDIQGGTHLVYEADMRDVASGDRADAMDAVRDVIERRVNFFGVAEPVVQVNRSGSDWRLIVELAGVQDINTAIQLIGETPFLEFRAPRAEEEVEEILSAQEEGERLDEDPYFVAGDLTGRYLERADVGFDQFSGQAFVTLDLTDEGGEIFQELTRENIGRPIAIYLDGAPISAPIVQDEISGGRAQITGNFTPEEAKLLVGRLNAGALPVPITLIAQQSVGASLGEESFAQSVRAGMLGFAAVVLFMLVWYRLLGVIAIFSLLLYISIVLAVFKLIPVTITIAGIAGFILSIGMAVDANILIFERFKEELRRGVSLRGAVEVGFKHAWVSIRDANISSLITAVILYWLGTSIVQGFALTLGIGVFISMLLARFVVKSFLVAVVSDKSEQRRGLFMSGASR